MELVGNFVLRIFSNFINLLITVTLSFFNFILVLARIKLNIIFLKKISTFFLKLLKKRKKRENIQQML